MPPNTFKTVESIGRTLPHVEVTTTWSQPTLKVRGKTFVCIASHKSAEPNTPGGHDGFRRPGRARRGRPWHLLPERSLPKLPLCSRPAVTPPCRRAQGSHHRRAPLRERQGADEVGRTQPPGSCPATTGPLGTAELRPRLPAAACTLRGHADFHEIRLTSRPTMRRRLRWRTQCAHPCAPRTTGAQTSIC